jgi:capsular polysaccharide transport system permease protein
MLSTSPSPDEPTLGEATFWQSLMIQKRVVGALLMREILTRFGRHNIGFLWLFIEPMIFTLAITGIASVIHHSKEGMSIAAFMITGYSTLLLWRNMPGRCLHALQQNSTLLFHRQVRPINIFLSRVLLEAIGATASLVVLTTIFHAAGLVELPKDYLWTACGWFLLMWYTFCVAIFVGSLSESGEMVERIWHPVMYIMVPLSGSFTTLESVPPVFRNALLYNPMTSCVEIFRKGFFGNAHVWHYDLPYVLSCNLLMTFVTLMAVRSIKFTPTT